MSNDSSSRIAGHLRSLVADSSPGSRLPSTRILAERFTAGPVTVQRAIATLVADGLVETRPGAGNFVVHRPRTRRTADVDWQTTSLGPERSGASPVGSSLRGVDRETIALHGGYPHMSLMPMREVRSALAKAIREDRSFERPPIAGVSELRAWFVRELTGVVDDAWRDSDAVITSGGQSALSTVFRALAGPGEPIVMESPTYWGAITAARQAGLVIVPVARTTGAPRPEDLDDALRSSGARLFYAQPNFANPTGALWNPADRREILDVIRSRRAFLVEDDWAHDFAIDETPVPLATADGDGHVVYIRSLTKSASLTLRVAAVVARGPARNRIANALAVNDLYVSPLLQQAALDVVTRPSWRTHCTRLRRELTERRDLLVRSVAEHAPDLELTHVPRGGLNLWLRLPEDADAETYAARALTRGVSISPGAEWFPADVSGPHIRLNYGSSDPSRFAEAAGVMQSLLG
ncbi:PLP-dependent aminotransferase family protein [Williamsia maris]|uniref:DNA-binding transcriptional regulator, MocR family, contains an aminotransferase domain n=1 Tax=Williamsia maris TaxID=72806 RepID=A0ABT1H8H1_9NOCA|nr:PLP-dependent aminotransferase family protein [Williamsia maris]MCP2174561.1 DNA-binding transcriptional regulator, MocR family, contains an aminotransferase domain [Williamsia maris]